MRRVLQFCLIAVASLLAAAGTASAASAPWTAGPGTSVSDDGVVTLNNSGGAGTSYETTSLDVAVANGDLITFEYFSTDVTCAGGTPRVFIQGGAYNTFDQDPNNTTSQPACGTAIGGGWYRVTTTVAGITDGIAGHTGIVNDNPADPGTILVRNLTIGGERVELSEEPTTGAPTSKQACKKGGWRNGPYKNQGQCVRSFTKAGAKAEPKGKAKGHAKAKAKGHQHA
ncbi:MAG TPA: hypothetical protein VIL49_18640 [Capillimicrobium sp.]|jgi:hypothetical protein